MNKVPRTRFNEQGLGTRFCIQVRDLFHKMQDFHGQECLSSIGMLQPYVKSSKGTSRTSLRCGILIKICRRDFFPTICSTREKEKNHTDKLRTRITFPVSSTKNSFFFGSQVVGFASNLSCLKYWLLCPFFYEEAICKGSTGKGLPYATKAVPAKDYFTHLTLTIAKKGR
jgi:hypothetical protein